MNVNVNDRERKIEISMRIITYKSHAVNAVHSFTRGGYTPVNVNGETYFYEIRTEKKEDK